jgi:serine protease inhibitor
MKLILATFYYLLLTLLAVFNSDALASSITPKVPNQACNAKNIAIASNNTLAMWMLKDDTGNSNAIVSPVGLNIGLALLQNGLMSNSSEYYHFIKTFCTKDSNTINNQTARWYHQLSKQKDLNIASAIWLQSGADYVLDASFAKKLMAYSSPISISFWQSVLNWMVSRDAGKMIYRVDFANNPKASANRINSWVHYNTKNIIAKLLSPSDLNKTAFAFLSTLYFHGDWKFPFDARNNKNGIFHVGNGEKKTVVFMHQSIDNDCNDNGVRYYQAKKFSMLTLPYLGNETMTILLPKQQKAGLNKFIQQLTLAQFKHWSDSAVARPIDVMLPKWTVVSARDWITFMRKKQLLPGKFTHLIKDRSLAISAVKTKVKISVDEVGTIAAAATSMQFGVTAIRCTPSSKVYFNADHPFVYIISDASGTILFLGKYTGVE